mgnify:CR=1 FL=1
MNEENPAKRLGFLVSPGSNESQGGGGLKLLPGAIGLVKFRICFQLEVVLFNSVVCA